jgi:cyclic pyranopterin phosphate synthase
MRLAAPGPMLAGIRAAEDAGFRPIKLNAVVVRDANDAEAADLARLTLDRTWHVRFIELMPLGSSEEARLSVTRYVSNVDTRRRIEEALGPLEPVPARSLSDESENFRVPGAPGVIGFISPVSRPYCGNCNRMRLTADGRFHLCLLRDDDVDVRGALRSAASREDRERRVREILLRAVAWKPTGHRLDEGFHTKGRRMHQIGG